MDKVHIGNFQDFVRTVPTFLLYTDFCDQNPIAESDESCVLVLWQARKKSLFL